MKIDIDQIKQLIEDYNAARTRRERREIENKVLEATVWQLEPELTEPFATFSEKQWRAITNEVETDDTEIQRLLRTPYVDLL